MINNLFSVFDPTTSLMSLSWTILILAPLTLPSLLWNVSSGTENLMNNIVHNFNKEVSYALTKSEKGSESIIITVFSFILIVNFLALYPQIFSTSSHLSVTLPLSLTFWMSLIIFGWLNNTNHILAHLVPQGTPPALMVFIVIIELTSNLIRPLTLCVRLTANLIAGHLLISLLGSTLTNLAFTSSMLSLPIPIVLTVLESAVAGIQAYVFITLITLYTTEIK